jgi:hypothetical protein
MKKVKISVEFKKFKKTKFTNIQSAIIFVKENKLQNTRLKLKKVGSIEEWDNF